MIQADSHPPQENPAGRASQIQAGMRHVGRRQWWLWSSAVMVTLLLTVGIASFAFPDLLSQQDEEYSFSLGQAVRGIVGLVLLFNVYSIYQQLQIQRIQRELTEQMSAIDDIGVRTDEVYKLAVLDPLTGLYNRRSGEQRLIEEISRSQRHGRPLTVVMFDLNKLKFINDRFGHAAGDELIKSFAARVNKAIRGSDLAIRLGGDEFLLLLPECKPEEVRHVLCRLSGMKMILCGQEISIAFSSGWTNYIPPESPEDLLKRADAALYVNKRAARDQRESGVAVN